MDFKDIIKAHLDKMAEQDAAFAARYALETKSLDACIQYIKSEAKKQAKQGFAAIQDDVVYGWAAHYYQEDNINVGNAKAKVVTPKAAKKAKAEKTKPQPKELKPLKALVKDKQNNNKCVQMDLFADFF